MIDGPVLEAAAAAPLRGRASPRDPASASNPSSNACGSTPGLLLKHFSAFLALAACVVSASADTGCWEERRGAEGERWRQVGTARGKG